LNSRGERDIQIDAAGLPPTTWANPEMMRQVIANLVSNAIKYSRPDTPISVWGRREDRFAAVSISDRGIGIPEGELSKLVEPYYRASNSRGVPGTGIGLFVVQRYVARHGGTVDIDSALGVGTTVTIRIPVKSQG
jgi:signal transduction histidine kinase